MSRQDPTLDPLGETGNYVLRRGARMIGRTIKHYRIIAEVGQGGMGMVYKAHDTHLDRDVALKFLPPLLSADSDAKSRFIHEAKAASSLDHPNICTIFDIDEAADGQLFIAMAYYEGKTLQHLLKDGRLDEDEAIGIASQIANALARAHRADIVHRDIKPANIMVTEDGLVKLLDFGIAKLSGATVLTKEGSTIGTVHYMSPEQAQGETVGAQSDIWSLGVLLHEMLIGERPFEGNYDQAIVYSILNTDPPLLSDLRPDASPRLEGIVERALEKNPDRRFQSAEEFLAELDELGGTASIDERDPASGTFRFGRRQRRILRRVAILAATVVVAAVVYLWLSIPTVARPVAIAVLPLISEAGDDDTQWLSNGITDGLITDLAQIDNLHVISRNSAMRYLGTEKSLAEIAEELNVTYVLDVSATKTGDIVRITTRLAEARTDQVVWSGRYESAFADVLDSQSEIARAVAEEIHGEISPEDDAQFSGVRKMDPQVYEAYLRGMHNINKMTPAGIGKGLEYLHAAVDLDPADPHAWAALASGYVTVGHGPAPIPDVWQRARLAAERAVTLDSTLAQARSVRGIVKAYYDWDWETAEKEFILANTLNPSLPLNHYHYAWYLVLFDRMDEAIAEHKIAEALDPLDPKMNAWMADMYRMAELYDEAEAQTQKAMSLGDRTGISQLVLGMTYVKQGRFEEALTVHEEMVAMNPIWRGMQGTTYAQVGREEDARSVALEIESANPNSFDALQLTFLYASLGDADNAFKWANHEPPHAFMPWFASRWSPLHLLKDDPRYGQLLERLDLPGFDG